MNLIIKIATSVVILFLAGCASSVYQGFYFDEKNPLESYIGMSNPEITDTGFIRFPKNSYKLINEFHTLSGKTGKTRSSINATYETLDIKLELSENPELNRVFTTSNLTTVGFFNIEEVISKANKNSKVSITCLNCLKAGMPTIIEGDFRLYREFEFKKTIGEYRKEFAERKRQVVISNREYAKQQELQKRQNEENLKKAQIEEAHRAKKIAIEGDGSSDDITCKRFGFKPQSSGYADCRLKLEVASRQATQQQSQYEEQKRQYDEQKRQHDAQLAEQKRQRQVGAGLALMQMGSGLLAPPTPPPPANQTIVTPSGRIVNCHTTGTVTNCF